MERLTQRDLRALFGCLEDVYAPRDAAAFPAHIAAAIARLVPSDFTTYSTVDLPKGRIANVFYPVYAAATEIVDPRISEYPISAHLFRIRDPRALKISDFLTRRQLHQQWWYNETWRRDGVEHNMTLAFDFPPPLIVGVTCNRSRTDFSERDRLLLTLLRPHLVQAAGNADAITRLQHELALIHRGLEGLGGSVVVLDPNGFARRLSPAARARLAAYFGPVTRGGDRLPDPLVRWVQQQLAVRGRTDDAPPPGIPLVVEGAGKRLVVRLVPDGAHHLLLLEEQQSTPNPGALEGLGLTRREAEVLAWVAQGKTNAEIGQILEARPRTVEKHLERIFQKLGVETRTAAASVVLTSPPR